MDELQMYGQVDLGTQISEPRETEGGGVTIAVEIKPEDGEERAGPGGRELRAVGFTSDEARSYALKLLAAVGPDPDRLVLNFHAGKVLVTLDMPPGTEEEIGSLTPWLFAGGGGDEQVETAVRLFGGLAEFNPPDVSDEALHAVFPAVGDASHELRVHISLPPSMRPKRQPTDAWRALVRRYGEQAEQVQEEQAAGDRLTADLIAAQTTTGKLLARLRELDRPVTVEELASVALVSVEAAREGVRELVAAKLVTESDEDPPMLTPGNIVPDDAQMRREKEGVVFDLLTTGLRATRNELATLLPAAFSPADLDEALENLLVANVIRTNGDDYEVNPGWRPCFDGEPGSALGFHEERGD